MGEGSKQVRVDNWGIFFLQRLQLFFNKTDYCDLTLQFEGNVQLKVHRLVMNACTEYFQILEQTCEIVDDVLIMPPDLQADVILPIVNFMYTGMLDFHMAIFDKLYKTADLMNITVLTKLLDAQKTPISPMPKPVNKRNMPIPHTFNLQGKKISAKTVDPDLPAMLPGRKLPVWKRKSAPVPVTRTVQQYHPEPRRSSQTDPLALYDNSPKPTRFEWPEDDLSRFNLFDSSFDEISYTSKPLFTQDDEPRPSTSFDRIKEAPTVGRRSGSFNQSSVDMNDVKDYIKQQKIRTNLTDYDDDDMADDDFENYDDDRNESQKRKGEKSNFPSAKRVRFNVNEKENQKQTKLNVIQSEKSSAEVDHTKIISEVLKKYPHLVKKNKNIRLKILAKSNNSTIADEQSTSPAYKLSSAKMRLQVSTAQAGVKMTKVSDEKHLEEGPWKCNRCSTPNESMEFVLYYLYRKHMTDVHNEKFDSRMCKYCGHKSSKHNMLMYHQYTKHGIKPPMAYNFPKCNKCPYIALTENLLVKHSLNHTKFDLQCEECKVAFSNQNSLTSHMQITGHSGDATKPNYDCQYCTKKYQTGSNLFTHIKIQHRDEARRDGIISIDEIDDADDEQANYEGEQADQPDEEEEKYLIPDILSDRSREKIKILSDVKLPADSQHDNSQSLTDHMSLEPSSEAEALSNVASGIATSLGLVDIVVLDDNQQYILHTNSQQGLGNNPEFILPELTDASSFTGAPHVSEVITSEQNVLTQSMLNNSNIQSTDELVMVLTDHDYGDGNNEIITSDNSNIVVLYSHPVENQGQFITSQGNIMLNSQDSIIELRNGNAVVTTAQQFVNNSTSHNDTHVESIEMIQQEINSHCDIKPNIIVTTASSNLTTVGDPLTQHVHILKPNKASTEEQQIGNEFEDSNMVLDNQVQFNTHEDIVILEETDDTQNLENAQDEEQTSETKAQAESRKSGDEIEENLNMEVDEDDNHLIQSRESVDQGASTDVENHMEQNPEILTNEESTDQEETWKQNVKNTENLPKVPSGEHISANMEDDCTEPNSEVNHPEENNLSEETMQSEEHANQDAEKSQSIKDLEGEISQSNEVVETEKSNGAGAPILGNENFVATDKLEIESEHAELGNEPSPSKEQPENSHVNEEVENSQGTIELELVKSQSNEVLEVENSQNNEESEIDNSQVNQELEGETSKRFEELDNSSSPSNKELQIETSKDEELEIEHTQSNEELHYTTNSQNTEDLQMESSTNNEGTNCQNEETEHGSLSSNNQREIENSQMLEGENLESSKKLEKSSTEPINEEHEDTSENRIAPNDCMEKDESSQSQESFETQEEEETAPVTAISNVTIAPPFSRNSSNQSAKIILEDWDDTDSQQSEQAEAKTSISVNKLIDDWADDEDEDGKKTTVKHF